MTRSTNPPPFHVRTASWQEDNAALRSVRETVFINEQQVPVELEWDELDEFATHLLAEDNNGRPIATARLLTDGHIGRVAVLRSWRHCGVGSALIRFSLELARRRGDTQVDLDAQVEAIPFYARFGFVAEGREFMDAGIPHRHMRLKLEDNRGNE